MRQSKGKAKLARRPAYGKPFLRRLWADLDAAGVTSRRVAQLAGVHETHVCNVRKFRRTSKPVVEAGIALREAARVHESVSA